MKKLIISVLGCAALASATAGGVQGAPAGGKYDILGLTLGMTARQAEADIAQRLHVHPSNSQNDNYIVMSGQGRYVPGRSYVNGLAVQVGKARLDLNFTEVPRGAGTGPEELWSVDYTPAAETTADKAAFVAQVHKKFGPPIKVFDQQEEYWANRAYAYPLNFDQANTPVLHLTTYSGELVLKNSGILNHMESLFNSRRTSQPQL